MMSRCSRDGREVGRVLGLVGLVGVVGLASSCGDPGAAEAPARGDDDETGEAQLALERAPRRAGGAVSCDFELPAEMDPTGIGPIIERDRMYMAAQPGMRIKHLPFSLDPATFRVQTGGRYLFDTAANARAYLDWLGSGFLLDGFIFLERPF